MYMKQYSNNLTFLRWKKCLQMTNTVDDIGGSKGALGTCVSSRSHFFSFSDKLFRFRKILDQLLDGQNDYSTPEK